MTPTPDQALQGILQALSDHPEDVRVTREDTPHALYLDVLMHPSDYPLVTRDVFDAVQDILKAVGGTIQKRVELRSVQPHPHQK